MSNIRQLRAWDNQNKTWVYSGRTPSMMHGFWKWVMYDTSTIVNEETGLKDKNGKEIYEGDIVAMEGSTKQGLFGVVIWHQDSCGFGWLSQRYPDDILRGFANKNRLEVIGNIHENPELLK